MSWTQELYKVYEQQLEQQRDKPFNDGSVLLPVSHSTANAQIEVTLKQDGTFVSASICPFFFFFFSACCPSGEVRASVCPSSLQRREETLCFIG